MTIAPLEPNVVKAFHTSIEIMISLSNTVFHNSMSAQAFDRNIPASAKYNSPYTRFFPTLKGAFAERHMIFV